MDGCNLGTNQCFPEWEETSCWVSHSVTPPTGNFQPFPSSFLPQNIYSKCTKLSTGGGGTQRSCSRGWVAPVKSGWQYPGQSCVHPSHTTRTGSRGDASDSYAGIEWEESSWNNHRWLLFSECVNTELLFYSPNRKKLSSNCVANKWQKWNNVFFHFLIAGSVLAHSRYFPCHIAFLFKNLQAADEKWNKRGIDLAKIRGVGWYWTSSLITLKEHLSRFWVWSTCILRG